MLEVRQVSKKFGGVKALSSVDFKVDNGEFIGIIGPNGSGKTTLFNVISGFYKPDSGRIMFDGVDITNFTPEKICHIGIGRTFQISVPFKSMSVLDNLIVAARYSRRSGTSNLKEYCQELLQFLEIDGKANLLATHLNVAENRRLDLGRALATKPQLLLLDEVVAGLNDSEIQNFLGLIKKVKERIPTILMIEHVMKVVMSISHKVIVLDAGTVISEGPPEEVARDQRVINVYLGTEA